MVASCNRVPSSLAIEERLHGWRPGDHLWQYRLVVVAQSARGHSRAKPPLPDERRSRNSQFRRRTILEFAVKFAPRPAKFLAHLADPPGRNMESASHVLRPVSLSE